MASESQTQRINALEQEVARFRAAQEVRSREADKTEAEFREALTDLLRLVRELRADLATVMAQVAGLQRQSDRGWGLWQALLVVAISVAASSITQLALRR